MANRHRIVRRGDDGSHRKFENTMKRRLGFVAVSETGLVRGDNQDSLLLLGECGVFCVADGMGGGCDGALASSIICEEIASSVKKAKCDIRSAVDCALLSANARICQYADKNGYRKMGSTAVILVFDGNDIGKAAVCHVGDSRVYRMRKGGVELLTDDHTLANQILRSNEGQWTESLRGRKSPLSHILTKVVGSVDGVVPEWREIGVECEDCFLICSDGVHDIIEEHDIAELYASACSLEIFSEGLKREILRRGAPDNFTYVIVEAGGANDGE